MVSTRVDRRGGARPSSDHVAAARQAITAEHQRDPGRRPLRGADGRARSAPAAEIEAALPPRTGEARAQHAAALDDPRDRAKLDELQAAYAAARAVLLDDRKRAAYDRELAGGELVQVPPAIDTELSFRVAEELMAQRAVGAGDRPRSRP